MVDWWWLIVAAVVPSFLALRAGLKLSGDDLNERWILALDAYAQRDVQRKVMGEVLRLSDPAHRKFRRQEKVRADFERRRDERAGVIR